RLRRCSLAARGLAAELICHMHQGEPYGHLTVKGNAAIAKLVGIDSRTVARLLTELQKNGCISVAKTGEFFSHRMVRDYEKASKRQADGALGGNPALKQVVNHEDKPTDTRCQIPESKNQDAASRQGTAEIVPVNEAPKAKLFRVGKTLLVSL